MKSVLLGVLTLLFAAPLSASAAEKTASRTTWRESGRWDLSLAAARDRMRLRMTSAGFGMKYELKMDAQATRFLYLWEKREHKVIYMLWRMDVDATGYSWGDYYEKSGQ